MVYQRYSLPKVDQIHPVTAVQIWPAKLVVQIWPTINSTDRAYQQNMIWPAKLVNTGLPKAV